MRVFILCTGRSGSTTIIKACKHITNYTSNHEHLSRKLGEKRFDYPDWHIEADNRLSWFLGTMDKKFGDAPIYIHLKRERKGTAKSFVQRFNMRGGIMDAFTKGILITPVELLNKNQRHQVANDYIQTVTDNIEFFLKDKSQVLEMNLETFKADFEKFWKLIGAEGDKEAALAEFDIKHNATPFFNYYFRYELKLLLYRIRRLFG